MSIFINPKKWTDQPPAGAQINFGHPLARGLTFYILFNTGAGLQHPMLPTNLVPTIVTGGTEPAASWISKQGGKSHTWDGNWGLWYERGAWVEPNWVTGVCRAQRTSGSETGDASLYRKAYQNAGAPPFVSHGLDWNPGGAGQDVLGAYIADQGGTLHAPTFSSPAGTLANVHTAGITAGPSGGNGLLNLYLNGHQVATQTVVGMTGIQYDTTSTGRLIVSGAESGANVVPIIGNIYYLGIWNRPLQASEMEWLHVEPYAMLVPMRKRTYFFTPPPVRTYSYFITLERLS